MYLLLLYSLGLLILLFNNICHILSIFSTSLQTLHLAELQLAKILLAQVHATNLVTHGISRDILLGTLFEAAGLLQSLFEHRLIGFSDTTNSEVHARTNLLNLDTWKTLTRSLGADGVDSQVDRRLDIAVASAVLSTDRYNVLETLNVDLVAGLTSEEIGKHALGESEFVANGAFEGGTSKQNHRSQTDGKLLRLELGNGAEALRVEVELEHIKNLVTKGTDKGHGVRALLLAAAEDEKRSVVLLGEKLERSGIVKRVDGVFLSELLGQRLAHLVKVVEGILDDLRA